MNNLLALLVAYLIVSLGYALFSMRTTTSHAFRLTSLLYLMVSIGLALYLFNQLLSQPKPIDQEYFSQAKEAVVLAVRPKDGQAIYLWLQLPDREAPAYYVMPWNGQAAGDLEIAQREAAQQDGLVLMNHPFKRSQRHGIKGDEKDKVFYASPPARPPLKSGELDGSGQAMQYRPPLSPASAR